MCKEGQENDYSEEQYYELANEVALILKDRLEATDVTRLLQIVFLDVNQAAELLGVKAKTIRTWVSEDVIPYRKANDKIIFLLAEILSWTLPANDRHAQHRLTKIQGCKIATAKLSCSLRKERAVSIYKRGLRWCYDIKIKGTRYRGTIPEARTKHQAFQAETKIRNEIFEGKYGTFQSSRTFREFVEKDFLPWARDNKRSWRNDFSRIKPLLEFFGSKKLADIGSFMIEIYKVKRSKTKTLRGETRSRTTVNRELQLLSRVLSMAVTNRELRTNPWLEVRKFKGEVRRKRYLLPDEEARQALVGRRGHLRLIVIVALHTGMRRGEILRLRKKDLDFHRGEIQVSKTKTDRDREIPMTPTLERELKTHCALLNSDFLFANPKTKLPITDIKHAFDSACEEAGIREFWFHDLRHTAATRMAERGVDPFTIAAIMGHTDINMTASYTHATASAKRAAVSALERASLESGPQKGHKTEQRPLMTAVG